MRTFLKYSMLLINLVFAGLLIATKLIPWLNPYEYNFLGLLGLFTPLFVAINLFFIFFWLFSRKFFYLIIPVVSIIFSWNVYSVCFGLHPSAVQTFEHTKNSFTVMSYNVRLLDLYHWNEDKQTRHRMISFLKKKNPSVLCLQEFYTGNSPKALDNIKAIQDACGYEYVSECNMHESKRGKWGNIIFSHLPLIAGSNIEIDVQGNNLLQKTDVVLDQDTFTVFNLHLKSNRFTKREADLVNKDELPSFNDSTLEQSKSIFQKLQDNSINRGLEADIIATVIGQNERPVVLCCDLNDIPCSFVYFKIKDSLQDAFLEKGFGFGKTYRNMIPLLRIDYIFHDKQLNLLGFEKPDVPFSDHEPILAHLSFTPSTSN